MLTDFQKRKLTRLFGLFDADGSAFVDHADFERIVGRLATAVGARPGSPGQAILQARYADLWKALAPMDADRDGRITLAEWQTGIDNITDSADRYDAVFGQMVDQVFDLFDADDDGQITLAEYRLWLTAQGVPADMADEAFYKLDLNTDGILAKDEMTYLMLDFFYSDDPKAPGNWLFAGPF